MTDRTTLHFLSCGHVDDGKSTLIGRLLYEVKAVPEDQIKGAMIDGKLDYSRLTDGLEDERSQGITIDAAYRYFRHNKRHYRIADTPGHIQYVRNMAVAAANSDCALILVDAAHGVREQTVRHSKIAAFFRIKHFIVAVNKMDLVNYDKDRFAEIEADYHFAMTGQEGVHFTFIPVSALQGDNVAKKSAAMPWYKGVSVLEYLEKLEVPRPEQHGVRLPVQSVVRVGDKRGYQGMLTGGSIKYGDRVLVASNRSGITVNALYRGGKKVEEAPPGAAITLVTSDDVDIARGDVLHAPDAPVPASEIFIADVLWLDPGAICKGSCHALLKVHNREAEVEIHQGATLGAVVSAKVFSAVPLEVDLYSNNPATGLFLIIEMETERVIGVGAVTSLNESEWKREVSAGPLKQPAYF